MTGKISEINGVKDGLNSFSADKITKVASKVFEKVDVNKDGVLSVSEILSGGVSALDTGTTEADFIKEYIKFSENTKTLQDTIKGFEEHLYSFDKNNPIHEVNITFEQRKELIKRIELFKLAEPYLKEDFKENQGYLDNVLAMLQTGKTITNQMIGVILWLTNPNKSIADGEIGAFKQGSLGDCWFLSALNCYASTKDGAQNIKDRISDCKNGKYAVVFQNPFDQEKQEVYWVYDKTLNGRAKNKTLGDKDVQVLEIAFGVYLEKYLPSDFDNDNDPFINHGYAEKEYLLHRALGYTGDITTYIKNDNKIHECFHYGWENADGKLGFIPMYTWGKYNKFKDIIENSKYKEENFVCSIPHDNKEKLTNVESKVLSAKHEYNLMKLSDEKVVVNNPHLTSFPIVQSQERFEELFTEMTYLPQETRIPYSKNKKTEEYSRPNKITGSISSAGECVWGACKMSAKWLYKSIINMF